MSQRKKSYCSKKYVTVLYDKNFSLLIDGMISKCLDFLVSVIENRFYYKITSAYLEKNSNKT